jgi:hypothetical protein
MTTSDRGPVTEPPNFNGCVLKVWVPGQPKMTRARKRAMQQYAATGNRTITTECSIAEAVKESLDQDRVVDADGIEYTRNPKVCPKFGKAKRRELPYLTAGIIPAGGRPLTLTWPGAAVPLELLELAVAHDSGEAVETACVELPLDTAVVYETGAKHGKRPNDPRRNHDTGKDGKPYPRPPRLHHGRVCKEDLPKAHRRSSR